MPTSVRLDSETEALLRRLARRCGRTQSEIIRAALQRLANNLHEVAEPECVHDAIADLVGIA